MPRGLSRRCFNKKLSQEVAARAMLVVAATVIVEGEQRVAHAVEVAADERPAHALVERSEVERLHATAGKAGAAKFAQTPRAARRNVVDEAHEVPGLRHRCAHRASRRP